MNMDFNTPRQERGAGTPGTFVSGGSATPMRGSPPTQEPLCGTEARKAKQAQRREAKLAQRTLLRAAAADTPAAFNPAVGTPAPVVPDRVAQRCFAFGSLASLGVSEPLRDIGNDEIGG